MTEKTLDKKGVLQKFRTEGILDAAMKVIARRGLEKATMEEVAHEAGISKATIYLYFKNKEDLYFHCVVSRFDNILAAMNEAAAGMDDPAERIRTLIRVQIRAIDAEKDFFRVFLTERLALFLDHGTEFGQGFWQRHERYAGLLTSTISEAMEKGHIREMDPVKAFYLLFSMVRGMAMCKLVCNDCTPMEPEADLILDVFFNGVGKGRG